MEFNGLSDKELYDKIENSAIMEKFINSHEWKLIEEACNRTAEHAKRQLLDISASDTVKIIELQQVSKLYGKVLKNLIKYYIDLGNMAIKEAKTRTKKSL